MGKKYTIESKAGVVHGTYAGASEKGAFMAMLAASGDAGAYGDEHVGTEADWIIRPAAMTNRERFEADLAGQYRRLFELPDYAMAAARYTPEALAAKMTTGLLAGTANKDGDGIKATCKALGIKHTYKAVGAYLHGE